MKKAAVILLHLGYWICYLFLLFVLSVLLHNQFIFRGFSLFIFLSAFAMLPAMLGFYSFYIILFTKFLKRKKIIMLVLAAIVIAIACGCIGWLLLNLLWKHMEPGHKVPIDQGGYTEVLAMVIIISVNALLSGIIGLVMRGFINWYADIKLKEILNRKNYEMELALVKSQINPHFLFNTIHNIDVLIEKDSIKASAYLNKLSEMLRFMLYEIKTEKIALAKELSYIEKYIDLQKIRTANLNYINYSVDGNANDRVIASMLFIPFIENAIKHTDNKKLENAINIKITVEKDTIYFTCENKYSNTSSIQNEYNGLGNELIQKRLGLLYPGRHSLTIANANNIYSVKLIIKDHED
ncbi:MAG: histidine kinase [Bacteroidota bacterium]